MNKLSDQIVENFEKINNHFGLNVREDNKAFYGTCKCHDSDNPTSFTLYKDSGIWRCFTQECHSKYGKTAIGFIIGLLSKQQKKEVSFVEAIKWLENFTGGKVDLVPPNHDEHLTCAINQLNKPKQEYSLKISKKDFISKLSPPLYYLKRKYKEETLNQFYVGECKNPAKLMYNRVLIPQFDNFGENVIGVIGRSIFEKCDICKGYHDPNSFCRRFHKFLNTDNFPSESTLYNFAQAKNIINKTSLAILTESNANVWRLHEAGFGMSLSCFGSKFTESQKLLLDTTSATTLIVVPDNDDAGKILTKHVEERCKYTHNIVIITPSYIDDVGKLNVETVKQILGPIVDKYVTRN